MKSLFCMHFGMAITSSILLGCATAPAPEIEAMTLEIPSYLEETFGVAYRPARELQFGNMTCLLDPKVTPENKQATMAFACNEVRTSGVTVTLGWKRADLDRSEVEKKVSDAMRLHSQLGPREESVKDVRVCTEEKIEHLDGKGILIRCGVNFFTTQKKYKHATFSVFYLNHQEKNDYQPFVITEGAFGRGDEEAQRDVVVYGEGMEWMPRNE